MEEEVEDRIREVPDCIAHVEDIDAFCKQAILEIVLDEQEYLLDFTEEDRKEVIEFVKWYCTEDIRKARYRHFRKVEDEVIWGKKDLK